MKLRFAIGAILIALAGSPAAAQQSDATLSQAEPAPLDDVVVRGTLEEQALAFTEQASGTPVARGLARWRGPVCIGVYNFHREVAEQIADGLAHSGGGLNVPIADGDCDPNIMIIGAVDARAVASAWVEREYREFRPKISGAARPRSQLNHFTTADAPIRWWTLSRPAYFDIFKGRRVLAGGPRRGVIEIRTAMNRDMHTRDDLQRIIIILDVDKIAGVSAENLIAYLTMISFTQIDMQADMGEYRSILNLFQPGHEARGLTEWDEAYVRGLYAVPRDLRIETELQSESMAERLRADTTPGEVD
jgi:hypothetical protein